MLFSRHEVKAYQYAFRLTRNSEEAADVVADAFIRVFNAIGTSKVKVRSAPGFTGS